MFTAGGALARRRHHRPSGSSFSPDDDAIASGDNQGRGLCASMPKALPADSTLYSSLRETAGASFRQNRDYNQLPKSK